MAGSDGLTVEAFECRAVGEGAVGLRLVLRRAEDAGGRGRAALVAERGRTLLAFAPLARASAGGDGGRGVLVAELSLPRSAFDEATFSVRIEGERALGLGRPRPVRARERQDEEAREQSTRRLHDALRAAREEGRRERARRDALEEELERERSRREALESELRRTAATAGRLGGRVRTVAAEAHAKHEVVAAMEAELAALGRTAHELVARAGAEGGLSPAVGRGLRAGADTISAVRERIGAGHERAATLEHELTALRATVAGLAD